MPAASARPTMAAYNACGEVARTGVHGANRLASNSLLEGLVFAERVARDLENVSPLDATPPARDWRVPPLTDRGAAQVAANMVRDTMWKYAGIVRSADGLGICLATLDDIERRLPEGATEEANLVETARLIALAALLREESRGGHYRTDFPRSRRSWQHRHVLWRGSGALVTT